MITTVFKRRKKELGGTHLINNTDDYIIDKIDQSKTRLKIKATDFVQVRDNQGYVLLLKDIQWYRAKGRFERHSKIRNRKTVTNVNGDSGILTRKEHKNARIIAISAGL